MGEKREEFLLPVPATAQRILNTGREGNCSREILIHDNFRAFDAFLPKAAKTGGYSVNTYIHVGTSYS